MSAICGIVHFDGKPVEQAEISSMVVSSTTRGPDGNGLYINKNAGFAHLAFDLTPESVRENQPLVNESDQLVLVADIRLDNRKELAKKLNISSIQLKELTDPELLMLAYRHWRSDCVMHLLGDFVFAIWDQSNRQLFMARDPLGAYSLSYCILASRFFFASETVAILDLPDVEPEINDDAVLKTLAGMQLEEDETFFQLIRYLAPAHCMTVTNNGINIRRYWGIDPGIEISYRQDAEYTDHFLELMERSVAKRLRLTGPVGISLSGGYDSTLLAAIAAKKLSGRTTGVQKLKSFSYVFDRFPDCDEREYIKPIVAQYGIDAHYLNSDHLWTFANLDTQSIPWDFFWTNCYSQLPLSIAEAAGNVNCQVLLDGMFGDALFCEPSLFAADLISKGRLIELFRLLSTASARSDWSRQLLDYGLKPLLPGWVRRAYHRLKPTDIAAQLPGLPAKRLQRLSELRHQERNRFKGLGFSPGKLTRYKRIFQPGWAQGFAATRNYPYNQHRLERVSPYFDRHLVEFVMAIPTEKLSNASRPRKLQNDAMRRLLPKSIHQRKGKTGLQALLECGLCENEKSTVRQLATKSLLVKLGWLNPDWFESLESGHGKTDSLFLLSQYLHLELWLNAVQMSLRHKSTDVASQDS